MARHMNADPVSATVISDAAIKAVVEQAHARPRFVEDSVRLALKGALDAYPALAGGDFLYSRRLVQEVSEKQVAALVLDASRDERFSASDSIVSSGVRSLLAAPLLDPSGCPGMIVLSSRAQMRRFSEDDMELLV